MRVTKQVKHRLSFVCLVGVLKPLTTFAEQLNQHFLHAVLDGGSEMRVRKKVKDIALLLLYVVFSWLLEASIFFWSLNQHLLHKPPT
jgi:hypothetical protein